MGIFLKGIDEKDHKANTRLLGIINIEMQGVGKDVQYVKCRNESLRKLSSMHNVAGKKNETKNFGKDQTKILVTQVGRINPITKKRKVD